MGDSTNELMNMGLSQIKNTEWERIRNIPEKPQYPSPAAQAETQGTQEKTTGTEQRDYYNYIRSLDLALLRKNNLLNGFEDYYFEWQALNTNVPFIDWIKRLFRGEING